MLNDEARQAHLRLLELVVEHTTNMVVVTNSQRQIEWVNPTYTRITGWTLDEVRGRNPKSFLHGPRTSLTAASRLGTRLRRGEPVTDFEMLNYKKSGEPYWVSLNIQPVCDESGGVSRYVAIQSDITERKRRELEVVRAHRQMQEAQRLANLGSLEHDLSSGALWATPQARHLLGLDEAAAICFEDWMARVHPADVVGVRSRYEAAVNVGGPYEDEYRLLHPVAGTRWVQVHGALAGWDDGLTATCRLAVQDITDRKRAELLAREKARMEEAARAQSQMLSRITHDFREPLHAMMGFADLIERQEGDHLSDAGRSHLRQIERSARHLLALVGDILDLGATQGGHLRLQPRPVRIDAAVAEVTDLLRPLALERQVEMSVQAQPPGLWVQADPQRLQQVLINLVGNALKYNRSGGRVDILIHARAPYQVTVAVTDTGAGIAREELARLFDAYYRAPPGTGQGLPTSAVQGARERRLRDPAAAPSRGEGGPEGSGLGLAIARGLARAMGGEIVAQSEPGTGSTFSLTLPTPMGGAVPPDEDLGDAGGGSPAAPTTARILYVEDNELNRLLVESYLATRPGHELLCCTTGAAALEAARRQPPDLLLLDMHLPDMHGTDVLQALRRDPLLHDLPCVMLSASDHPEDRARALAAGCNDYLTKPIACEAFMDRIEALLPACVSGTG